LLFSIPNVVTLGRIVLVPVIFWLLVSGKTQAAFIAFVCAGVSDAIDGFLAKRFQLQTELGSYLDPLADKLLIVSIYIALGVATKLPSWLVIAVVSRDILIVVAVLLAWVIGNPLAIQPRRVSKINTISQLVLAATVLAADGFGLRLGGLIVWLVWITGMLTVTSLAVYMNDWISHMAGNRVGIGADPDGSR
jgi:cardiolipin synthase